MAVWTAVELYNSLGAGVGVTLTPVGKGRFEVYADGELLYDNKAKGVQGIDIDAISDLKMRIRDRLEAATAAG